MEGLSIVKKAFVSFSGGKDSTLALHKARERGYEPVALLNMMNSKNGRTMSHAIPNEVLEAQAEALGLPLLRVPTSWELYERDFIAAIGRLKDEYGVEAGVFGDIDIEAHLEWEKAVCAKAGVEACLPLWGLSRAEAVELFLGEGFSSVIIVVDTAKMPAAYIGELCDRDMVKRLVRDGIDVCGESGEFHTLAVDGPCFTYPLRVITEGTANVGKHCFLNYRISRVDSDNRFLT